METNNTEHKSMEIEVFTMSDGDFFSVQTRGHVDKNKFAFEVGKDSDRLGLADILHLNYSFLVEHLYLADRGGECNHQFCEPDAPGAFPVTAVKLY